MECSSEINPAPTRLPGYNRFTMVTNFSILDIVTIAFGCAASGLAIDFVGSPFVGALILMLVGCATAFILAVTPFLESPS